MSNNLIIRQGEQIDLVINDNEELNLQIEEDKSSLMLSIEKTSGTTDYNNLTGKPSINGVTVKGEKTGPEYRLQNKMDVLSVQEIEKILYL